MFLPLIGMPGGSEWLIIFVILIPLYFVPSFIARKSKDFNKILLLNLLGGWTTIGWIVALIWAIMSVTKKVEDVTTYQSAGTNSSNRQQEKINQLQQLKDLLDKGVLTKEEFERQKAEVLSA